jgi:hypothetical protein
MKYHFVMVYALRPDAGQEELNRFCAGHKVAPDV